jgi:inhibitor of KinA
MNHLPKISPLGDSAVTVDFGNEISLDLNDRAIALASDLAADPFPGFIESVPAYSSLTVFFDLPKVCDHKSSSVSAHEAICRVLHERIARGTSAISEDGRVVEIPVDFGDAAALDIDVIASSHGGTRDEVIDIFVSRIYRVYMLGFLPGFAYMGEVDERIAVPRRSSPRLKVPKGSVGIAGRQTGIYPFESPGGWQIIGRTELEMFTPLDESPCRLQPGDQVRFVAT